MNLMSDIERTLIFKDV